MNITDERNRLKNEIDKVSDPDILSRISAILAFDERSLLTDEQIVIVRERREEYLRDPSTAICSEDFDKEIKKVWVLKLS